MTYVIPTELYPRTRSPATALARLLVVDDEPHIRSALTRALSLLSYAADEAGSGQEALRLLQRTPYDLMVLDMCLPDLGGLEIMRQARQIRPGLLVIILTGYATLESAITAVKSAEVVDYLIKPASVHEVAAGVARALRQHAEQLEKERLVHVVREAVESLRQTAAPMALPVPPPAEHVLRAYPLKLDCQKRLLVWEDNPACVVELTEGETKILACLMSRPDQVVSCRELTRVALGYQVDKNEAQQLIRPYIFRLRQKVEAEPGQARFIRTVRGGGYLFAPSQAPSDSTSLSIPDVNLANKVGRHEPQPQRTRIIQA